MKANKMEWKHCKWCDRWIKSDEEAYCKMCKEYFDVHPEHIVKRSKIVIKKIGE
jgi:hypothetical protein